MLACLLPAGALAQARPAVRQLGAVLHVSAEPLASAAAALPMPGGRVLVNDITGRRLLLFDSTLAKASVIADTTGATANAYGRSEGTLIRYRGDSALYIDIASLSMLVISPTGAIARVMAVPRPDDAQMLIGSVFGTPGFDAQGRLVSYGRNELAGNSTMIRCCIGRARITFETGGAIKPVFDVPRPDSAFVVRTDLSTRTSENAVTIRVATVKTRLHADDQGYLTSVESIYPINTMVDEWTVCRDGSIAVVRGGDYHVDWLGPDGTWNSSPKIPFDWQRIDDARKQALIDSSANALRAEARADSVRTAGGGVSRPGQASRGGRGGGAGGGGRMLGQEIPGIVGLPALADVPGYAPAFTAGGVQADVDNNLWIRTTTLVKSQPVYDVISRRGELIDRVQLPPYRTIAGFAPGMVYMAVKDASGIVHLERARIR